MKFFKQHSQYESEFSRFLQDMKKKNPDIEKEQRAGRSIWWDKAPLDLDQRSRAQESSIKQQAYVYQSQH